MGVTRLSFSCLLLAAMVISSTGGHLLDTEGVQGPKQMVKRTLPNSWDCPPGMNPPSGIEPPSPINSCPPGTVPVEHPGQVPHGIPSEPGCDPWVDDAGDCHIADLTFDGQECLKAYGIGNYTIWQEHYRRAVNHSPFGERPSEPDCMPA
ncbi:hypothetical protein ACOMHN_027969 [Nucella lapillus]